MKTIFKTPIKVSIERYPSGEVFYLLSLDTTLNISETNLIQITDICNQDLVYNTLFREKFEGKQYSEENARGFTKWAKDGWSDNNKFVFLITNSQNEVVGATDIKSADLDSAEIGYWLSETYSGVMTNAVKGLCDLAKSAGYKSLFGMTVPHNEKSQNVLLRAGFVNKGMVDRKGKEYFKFEISLL